jgi:hypothetical protein
MDHSADSRLVVMFGSAIVPLVLSLVVSLAVFPPAVLRPRSLSLSSAGALLVTFDAGETWTSVIPCGIDGAGGYRRKLMG